jgi:polar amino acid transport system permease protein
MKEVLVALLGKPSGIVVAQLLDATQFTIYLSLIAFLGGGLVGLIITLTWVLPSRGAKRASMSYIWLFQSTPLLMLLFLTGLGVPQLLDTNINPWTAATVSLTVYASAYMAEVWRGAVQAVPPGQWEAARAQGLRLPLILRLIILPQAVRYAVAPTVGFMVQLIKGTSLAYIIGFQDLMSIGKRWANASVEGTEPFVIYPIMGLIYFCLCFPLTRLSKRLEHRLGGRSNEPQPTAAA